MQKLLIIVGCALLVAAIGRHLLLGMPDRVMLVRPRYVGISGAFVGRDFGARSDVTRDQRGGMAIILCRHDRGNCADRALAGIALLAIARGNRRRESVLSNQHRLLGKDTRHRALR